MIRPVLLGAARALAALAAIAALGCAASEPSRQLYQWTDAEGNVRYTPFPDRIPSSRADTRQVVERRPSRPPVEAAPVEQDWGAPTSDTEPPPLEAAPPEESPPPVEAAPPKESPPPVEAAPPEESPPTVESASQGEAASDGAPVGELETRIAALESRIAADQETLKNLISDPARVRSLRNSEALDEIATRLPELQEELARLRAQRDDVTSPPDDGAPADDAR